MKNKKNHFARGLRTGASIITLSLVASFALAQSPSSDEAVDEIEVTGIRNALESSMNIKRNAKGIVDSISAEDIGKFPDSNLAESLQRITGLSIDRNRASGEGRHVTARGFGADFNLVTFNGRNMPTSTLGNFASAPSTRSFDFGNLASEAVSRVDVYKTSKASTSSGGMGSTIDIRTTRPLEIPGFTATVGVKQIDDKSQDGSPHHEVSALVYNTWMDDRIGLAITAIESSLNHRVASFRQEWSGFEAIGSSILTPANDEATDMINGVSATGGGHLADGTLISTIFGNAGYYIDDLEQSRRNLQLTFQARPIDNVTVTVDATNARLNHEVNTRNAVIHIQDDSNNAGTTTSTTLGAGNPATIERIVYNHADVDDFTNTLSYQNNITEVSATGLNVEWNVDERLSLEFDFHSSESESKPLSPYGSNAYIGSTSKVMQVTTIDYTSELPVITLSAPHSNLLDAYSDRDAAIADPIHLAHRHLTGAANLFNYMNNEIEQTQIRGSYDFAGSDFADYVDVIKFGASQTDNSVYSAFHEIAAPNWDGVLIPRWDWWPHYGGEIANGLFPIEPLRPYFSDLNGSDRIFPSIVNAQYADWFSAYQAYGQLQATRHNAARDDGDPNTNVYNPALICGDNTLAGCSNFTYSTQRFLEEETLSFYAEAEKEFFIRDMLASLVVGLRYEETDVTSRNYLPRYSHTVVTGDDRVTAVRTGESIFETTTGSYDYLLPSIDFDIAVMDDVKVRASYSQSIARHTYDKLAGGVSINGSIPNAAQQPNDFTGGGSEGNPNLEPFESENIDLSAEWYYGDLSYMSLGYFQKKASNWVGVANDQRTLQGLRHARRTGGAIVDAANNTPSTDANDLVVFNVGVQVESDREETIDGLELAFQHDFGDYNPFPVDLTGFGIIANMTVVDSDANYRNTLPNSAVSTDADAQFAIIGISDSHNLSVYYERFGVSARVAYNWRDRFLNFSGASSGYTEEAEQIDANISYTIPDTNVTLSYDGINLTEEGSHTFERNNPSYTTWRNAGHAKHYVGLRWKY